MADPTPDSIEFYKHDKLLDFDYTPPSKDWMDTPVDFRPGTWIYPAKPKNLEYLEMDNPREWSPADEDWKLPDDWKERIFVFLRRSDQYFARKVCVPPVTGSSSVPLHGQKYREWKS